MSLKILCLDRKRLLSLALFVFALFTLILLQFFKIQVIEGDKWTERAQAQHQKVITEPFMRGKFFSNTSIKGGKQFVEQPFVIDIPKYHLFIDPFVIPEESKKAIAEKLFEFFPLDIEGKEKLLSNFYKESRSRKLVSFVDQERHEKIQKWWHQFARREKIPSNALYFVKDYLRSYPFGSLLGQLLHTVQEEKDPHTQQSLPTGGLELYFNKYLKGKLGKRLILRSPRHPLDNGKLLVQPENGCDVYLTINHYLQGITEKELEKGVKDAKAKGGWAVMMDPNSGEILALAQYPSFDLSNYRKYFNEPNLQDTTRVKAACDAFEPGSIMKPIFLSLALKANEELAPKGETLLFSPHEKIATSNGKIPGKRTPLKDGSRVHYFLNMYMGLQKSSNIYISKIVQRVMDKMGGEWYRKNLTEIFGFGKKSGVEIPAETLGAVPTPGKLHPNGRLEWSAATPYTMAIGHNITVNSIQMAKAFSILANGGFAIQPTILRKIVKRGADGEEIVIVDNTQNRMKNKRVLSQSIINEIVKGLRFVTKVHGSSPFADVKGYSEAGKTGTAEKIVDGVYSKKRHISSFIGFTPAKEPRFVLMVTIDEPEYGYKPGVGKIHHGGPCAGGVFQRIASQSLHYLGVAPDDPFSYPGREKVELDKCEWMKEVKELHQLYNTWNSR